MKGLLLFFMVLTSLRISAQVIKGQSGIGSGAPINQSKKTGSSINYQLNAKNLDQKITKEANEYFLQCLGKNFSGLKFKNSLDIYNYILFNEIFYHPVMNRGLLSFDFSGCPYEVEESRELRCVDKLTFGKYLKAFAEDPAFDKYVAGLPKSEREIISPMKKKFLDIAKKHP